MSVFVLTRACLNSCNKHSFYSRSPHM